MRKYAKFVVPAVLLIGVLVFLLANLSSSLVYYNTPAELEARQVDSTRLRLAGRVTAGSVSEGETTVMFSLEDCTSAVTVVHTGAPPQLFSEGRTVIVEGTWDGDVFSSSTMLIKHDEQYRSDADDYDQELNSCSEL